MVLSPRSYCLVLLLVSSYSFVVNIKLTNRVRDHTRPNTGYIRHARLTRWFTPNRPSLRYTRVRKHIRCRPTRIRSLPIPSFRISSNGSFIPITFLPIPKTPLLGIYRSLMVGNNVSLASLPHRLDGWSLFIGNGLLLVYAGGIQGFRSDCWEG